jgi:hypothetical protein
MQEEVFPCRPSSGAVWHWIESTDYSPAKRLTYNASRLSIGLLDEASIERGEHVSAYHAPRVGTLADGYSRLLSSVGSRLLRLMPSIRITSAERFHVTDNRDRVIATVGIAYHFVTE